MKIHDASPFLSRFLSRTREEDGSAIVEYLLLALPLFLPLSIFLVSISTSSTLHTQARNLARQSVRAYVTGANLDESLLRVEQVKETFLNQNSQFLNSLSGLTISFICSNDPCLTPGGMVTTTVHLPQIGSTQAFDVNAKEYVDQWISQ
jgi:Flp pilus assembly protein TadG